MSDIIPFPPEEQGDGLEPGLEEYYRSLEPEDLEELEKVAARFGVRPKAMFTMALKAFFDLADAQGRKIPLLALSSFAKLESTRTKPPPEPQLVPFSSTSSMIGLNDTHGSDWLQVFQDYVVACLEMEGTFMAALSDIQTELGLPENFYAEFLARTQDQHPPLFSPSTIEMHPDGSSAVVRFSKLFP